MDALLIILGIIAALIVLAFTVRVRITLEMKDELKLSLRVLGITVPILPKKPKKYKLSDYTEKKIKKRDERAAKRAERAALKKKARDEKKKLKKKQGNTAKKLTRKEKKALRKKKLESLPPLGDMMSLFIELIKLLFSGLFKKFHFHVDRLKIKVGGADAAQIALIYTAITNGLHPLFAFIEKNSNLHGVNRADIEISTDYLSESIEADVKIGFSTSLGGVIGALLRVAFRGISGWIRIAPKKELTVSSEGATAQNQRISK